MLPLWGAGREQVPASGHRCHGSRAGVDAHDAVVPRVGDVDVARRGDPDAGGVPEAILPQVRRSPLTGIFKKTPPHSVGPRHRRDHTGGRVHPPDAVVELVGDVDVARRGDLHVVRTGQQGFRGRPAVAPESSGPAAPCDGSDHAGGGVDPADPVVRRVRHDDVARGRDRDTEGPVERRLQSGPAVARVATQASARHGRNPTGRRLHPPYAVVSRVRDVEVARRGERNPLGRREPGLCRWPSVASLPPRPRQRRNHAGRGVDAPDAPVGPVRQIEVAVRTYGEATGPRLGIGRRPAVSAEPALVQYGGEGAGKDVHTPDGSLPASTRSAQQACRDVDVPRRQHRQIASPGAQSQGRHGLDSAAARIHALDESAPGHVHIAGRRHGDCVGTNIPHGAHDARRRIQHTQAVDAALARDVDLARRARRDAGRDVQGHVDRGPARRRRPLIGVVPGPLTVAPQRSG